MTTRPQKHGAFVIRLKTVGLILFLLWLTFPPLGASQKQLLSVSFVSDHPLPIGSWALLFITLFMK